MDTIVDKIWTKISDLKKLKFVIFFKLSLNIGKNEKTVL